MDGYEATRRIRHWEYQNCAQCRSSWSITMPTEMESAQLSDDQNSGEWYELQDCPHNRVPVVALTADALNGTLDLCLKAGMDEYMSKVNNTAAGISRGLSFSFVAFQCNLPIALPFPFPFPFPFRSFDDVSFMTRSSPSDQVFFSLRTSQPLDPKQLLSLLERFVNENLIRRGGARTCAS